MPCSLKVSMITPTTLYKMRKHQRTDWSCFNILYLMIFWLPGGEGCVGSLSQKCTFEILIHGGDWGTIGEANAVERKPYYLRFPREGGMPCHAGPQGKHLVWWGGGRITREGWAEATALIGVSKGEVRKDRVNSLGLTGLNNCTGLWGIGASLAVWYLALGRGNIGLMCESSIKEVLQLHLRGVKLFTTMLN